MREKTNSITHLVKIVAGEVLEEKISDWRISQANEGLMIRRRIEEICNRFLGDIQTSLEKAGQIWSAEEDQLLQSEVRTALAQIAKNHKRSIVAIRSRIDQKELI